MNQQRINENLKFKIKKKWFLWLSGGYFLGFCLLNEVAAQLHRQMALHCIAGFQVGLKLVTLLYFHL